MILKYCKSLQIKKANQKITANQKSGIAIFQNHNSNLAKKT